MTEIKLQDDELEKLVLELLPKNNGFMGVWAEVQKRGYKNTQSELADVFQKLQSRNIIRPAEQHISSWLYRITSYGESVLEEEQGFIYLDPNTYIQELYRETGKSLTPTTEIYLHEAIEAYLAGRYLSSTVMLGCASESAIYDLIEEVLEYMPDATTSRKLEKAGQINRKFKIIKDYMNQKDLKNVLKDEFQVGSEERDNAIKFFKDFDSVVANMFTIYRLYRNDQGHPTGEPLDKNVLKAELSVIKKYFGTIYGLIYLMGYIGLKRRGLVAESPE